MKLEKVKKALLSMQRHSWEQGVAMQAFWELGDKETAIALAIEAAYRKIDDGRLAAIGGMEAMTDPCAVGEVLKFATEETGLPELKEAYEGLLHYTLNTAPRNREGTLYHMNYSEEFWVDSIYMLPPFLAAAGHFEEAIKQIDGYWKALFNEGSGLLCHRWNEALQSYERDALWGTGNGWTMAGLCRVIDLLPDSMETEKQQLIKRNQKLIETVSNYIREDGLAHDVLDDPNTFTDAALPMMFAYSIYRGMKSGWLDGSYLALADKCRLAATKKVDAYGFVRDVAGAPHFDKPGISPEAQAFYLLMSAAYDHIKED